MSKEKMDAYKEAKKNRKENIEKEKKAKKFDKIFWRVIVALLAVGVAVLIGLSIANAVKKNRTDVSAFTETEFVLQDEANIQGTAESESDETEEASGADTTEGTEAENKTE